MLRKAGDPSSTGHCQGPPYSALSIVFRVGFYGVKMWSAPLGRHVWAGATVVTLLAASRVAGESSVPVAAAPIPDINVWLETNWQAPPILLELL